MIFQSAFHRGMECYQGQREQHGAYRNLSVRFSSRYGMLQPTARLDLAEDYNFQSAFHRGMECYAHRHGRHKVHRVTFSPLFIAVWNVTPNNRLHRIDKRLPFSPLFIAVWNVTFPNVIRAYMIRIFQSAFHRGMECYFHKQIQKVLRALLSVRFSSRYGMLQTLHQAG